VLILSLAKVYINFEIPQRIHTVSILSENGNIGNKIVGCQSFLITGFKVFGVMVLNCLLLCFRKLILSFICVATALRSSQHLGILESGMSMPCMIDYVT
jgi:hypothetical protein